LQASLFLGNALLVIAAAFLHAASWLDERYFPFAWIGLALLFFCCRGKSIKLACVDGLLFGCVMLSTSFYWATNTLAFTLACEPTDFTPRIAFVCLIAWESLPFAFLAWIYAKADRGQISLWVVPLSWVLVEAYWPRVFPWVFAHSQTAFTPFVQPAEWGGALLVSAIFVAGCVGVSQLSTAKTRRPYQAEAMVGVAIISTLLGFMRMTSLHTEAYAASAPQSLRIGVVQVDPSFMESTTKMRAQIDSMATPLDLVILPESTLSCYSTKIERLEQIVRDLSIARDPYINVEPLRGLSADLIVGGKSFICTEGEGGPEFQTAFSIGKDGKLLGRYFKRYLLPIGEYVPFEKTFPKLHEWAQLDHYIDAGRDPSPLILSNGAKVGTLVCYEDTVPEAARTTVASGAEVLVCIINGSAFESPVALQQHRRLAQLRSVENRRTFIRCAATGDSCVISATGEMLQSVPLFQDGSLVAQVDRCTTKTLYTRAGYLFPYLCALICTILTGWSTITRRLSASSCPKSRRRP
jgi:apolipoprotein N-acyltransferase